MTSNINPNNIDGSYPVAGQDNNSQGFRDNFTNTSTNFQYAAEEITDLQNKAVLKAALTGTTLNNDMGGSVLSNAQTQMMSQTVVNLGTLTGTVPINYAAGSYQTVTTSGPITLAFSNFTAAGTQDFLILQVTVSNTTHTMTLPSAVGAGASAQSIVGIEGISGQVITFANTGTYQFQFTTADAGATVYLSELTRPRNLFTNTVAITANTAAVSTSTGALIVGGGAGIAGDLYVGGNISGNIPGANYSNANVAAYLSGGTVTTDYNTSGNVSATGNITGGNINTGGGVYVTSVVSATGNVRGGNVNSGGLVSAVGNVIAGNVTTAGAVSAVGNVSAANFGAVSNISAINMNIGGSSFVQGNEPLGNAGVASLAVTTEVVTTASASTATLAAGSAGQIKNFVANSIAGNMVVTVTNAGWKASGTGTLTLSAIGQGCQLIYINSKWYVIGNNGATFA